MEAGRFSGILLLLRVLRDATPVLCRNQTLTDALDRLKRATAIDDVERLDRLIWSIWSHAGSVDAVAAFDRASTVLSRGDFAGALKALDQTVILDPSFAEGWNRRATVYFILGKHKEAIADISRAIILEPRHYGALSGLGQILQREGEREGAALAFETALGVNPHLSRARVALKRMQALGPAAGIVRRLLS